MKRSLECHALAIALLLTGAVQAAPIGYDGARHLLNRTGFGATEATAFEQAALALTAVVADPDTLQCEESEKTCAQPDR